MTHSHWLFEILAILHFLVVVSLIANILLRQKNYGVAIAWIVVLLFMPFVEVVLYTQLTILLNPSKNGA